MVGTGHRMRINPTQLRAGMKHPESGSGLGILIDRRPCPLDIVYRFELKIAGEDFFRFFNARLPPTSTKRSSASTGKPFRDAWSSPRFSRAELRFGLALVELLSPLQPLGGIGLGPVHEDIVGDLAPAILFEVKGVLDGARLRSAASILFRSPLSISHAVEHERDLRNPLPCRNEGGSISSATKLPLRNDSGGQNPTGNCCSQLDSLLACRKARAELRGKNGKTDKQNEITPCSYSCPFGFWIMIG